LAVALAFAPEPEAPDVPVERLRRRPRSLGLEPLTMREIEEKRRIDGDPDLVAELAARPRDRRDCRSGPRPCPWVACAMHLALSLTSAGAVKVSFPDGDGGVDFDAMAETCALDVSDRGDQLRLDEVGVLMNLTHVRVMQIERWAKLLARVELSVPASRSRTERPVRPARREAKPLGPRARTRALLTTRREQISAWLAAHGPIGNLAGIREALGPDCASLPSGVISAFVRREFPELAPRRRERST
jgi:hypothetical protein